jgi:hypothetical protein
VAFTPSKIILFGALRTDGCAYGIEACLSAILGNKNTLHSVVLESRMLRACADVGTIDGLSGRSEFSVDGLPENIQLSIIAILHEIVEGTKKGYDPHLET